MKIPLNGQVAKSVAAHVAVGQQELISTPILPAQVVPCCQKKKAQVVPWIASSTVGPIILFLFSVFFQSFFLYLFLFRFGGILSFFVDEQTNATSHGNIDLLVHNDTGTQFFLHCP